VIGVHGQAGADREGKRELPFPMVSLGEAPSGRSSAPVRIGSRREETIVTEAIGVGFPMRGFVL
jgi:hypothetical protein